MRPKSLDTSQKLYSRIFFSNILTYLERLWQPWPWGECSKVVSSFCWQGRLWTLLSWLLSGVRTPSDPTPVKPNLCRRCVGKRSSRWATCGDSLLGRNLWGYNTNRGMGGGLRWWKGKCLQSGAHFMTRFPIQQGFWLGGSNVYCFQQYLGWLWEYIYTHFLGMFKQIHHQQLESEE